MSAYLRKFATFEGLSEADVAMLERIMVVETHADGHVFIREGDRATAVTASMYVVLEGEVAVVAKAPDGGFGVRRNMGAGEVFGVVAFVADHPRTATVRATGTVRTARLDRGTFSALYQSDAGVHARFQLVVARQLAADIRNTGTLLATAIESGDCAPVADRFDTQR